MLSTMMFNGVQTTMIIAMSLFDLECVLFSLKRLDPLATGALRFQGYKSCDAETNITHPKTKLCSVHAAVTQLPTLTPVPLRPRKSFGVRS